MRILFDQGTPAPLRAFLQNHAVETAFERGWSELGNGELISEAEENGFEMLLTTDKNLRYQQIWLRAESRFWFCGQLDGPSFATVCRKLSSKLTVCGLAITAKWCD